MYQTSHWKELQRAREAQDSLAEKDDVQRLNQWSKLETRKEASDDRSIENILFHSVHGITDKRKGRFPRLFQEGLIKKPDEVVQSSPRKELGNFNEMERMNREINSDLMDEMIVRELTRNAERMSSNFFQLLSKKGREPQRPSKPEKISGLLLSSPSNNKLTPDEVKNKVIELALRTRGNHFLNELFIEKRKTFNCLNEASKHFQFADLNQRVEEKLRRKKIEELKLKVPRDKFALLKEIYLFRQNYWLNYFALLAKTRIVDGLERVFKVSESVELSKEGAQAESKSLDLVDNELGGGASSEQQEYRLTGFDISDYNQKLDNLREKRELYRAKLIKRIFLLLNSPLLVLQYDIKVVEILEIAFEIGYFLEDGVLENNFHEESVHYFYQVLSADASCSPKRCTWAVQGRALTA